MNKFNHEKREFFRSAEEWYFSWWLDDLMDAGLVFDWEYESKTFMLSEPFKLDWEKELKTKTKKMEYKVLEKCTYTPDFKIVWNESAKDILYHNIGDKIEDPKQLPYFFAQNNETWIEIKPNHDFQNKTQQAVIKVKWLNQLGTWCQIVVPSPKKSKGKLTPHNALFSNTFVPYRFLYTDQTNKKRKINYEFLTLDKWLDTKQ